MTARIYKLERADVEFMRALALNPGQPIAMPTPDKLEKRLMPETVRFEDQAPAQRGEK